MKVNTEFFDFGEFCCIVFILKSVFIQASRSIILELDICDAVAQL